MRFEISTPSDWQRSSISKYCHVQLGKMLQSEPSGEDDELLPYLRAISISKNGVDTSHEFLMWIRPHEKEKFRLRRNDVLVSEGGDAGRTAHFNMEGEYYIQNAINRVRPLDHNLIESRYLFYWFTFLKLAGYVDLICNVATIAHFTAEKVKAAPFAFPSFDTQKRITAFLDEKTARIDGLIAKKQDLLERLAEKRQAIITQAVTKGLNPAAPMKDSGIEWLEQIPAHWEVKRLKFVCEIAPGYAFSSDDFVDEGCAVVRISDVMPTGIVDVSGARFLPVEYLQIYRDYCVRYDDVLMAMTGATVAKAARFLSENGALINQRVCRMRPIERLIDKGFLWFLTQTTSFIEYIKLYAYGGAQPNISDKLIGECFITCPTPEDQELIVRFLSRSEDVISRQIDLATQSVKTLQEYRAALITAAITGQIEGLR